MHLGSTGLVNAATVTFSSGVFGSTSVNVGVTTSSPLSAGSRSSFSDVATVSGFDSSLGTLTSVDISLTGLADLSIDAEFIDSPDADLFVVARGSALISRTFLSVQGFSAPTSIGDDRFGFNDRGGQCEDTSLNSVFLSAKCELNFFFFDSPYSQSFNVSDPSFLPGYIDNDISYNVFQNFDYSIQLLDGDTGSLEGVFNTTSTVEITYTYSPVPIPAAAYLFASALGLLGWVRRRQA
jgi:hypothetical protein